MTIANRGGRKGKYDSLMPLGAVFGRLTSLGEFKSEQRQRKCLLECSCGSKTWVSTSIINKGTTRSCGGLSRELASKRMAERATHGKSNHPLYRVWRGMMSRCYKPEAINYKNYGAKNIEVFKPWHAFENFFRDMEGLWVPLSNMDRIDSLQGYFPSNVRFVSPKVNQRNRGNNRLIDIDGVVLCSSAWAEMYGINSNLFRQRMSRDGLSPKAALGLPL